MPSSFGCTTPCEVKKHAMENTRRKHVQENESSVHERRRGQRDSRWDHELLLVGGNARTPQTWSEGDNAITPGDGEGDHASTPQTSCHSSFSCGVGGDNAITPACKREEKNPTPVHEDGAIRRQHFLLVLVLLARRVGDNAKTPSVKLSLRAEFGPVVFSCRFHGYVCVGANAKTPAIPFSARVL